MRILLTGGGGMLGAAIQRLNSASSEPLALFAPARGELDCADQSAVAAYFRRHRFDMVIHAAAKVGGIGANIADPVGFLTENLALNLSVIGAAAETGVPQLINIGSSCMYPKDYRQPLVEEDLLQGPLEPTNEGYALAKIAAARHCDYLAAASGLAYRTLVACNLYGPNDSYSAARSHLVASIIAKTHDAKQRGAPAISIWGDGSVRREFLFVDDLARWILLRARQGISELPQYLNVGAGTDYSVLDYYRTAAEVIGFAGQFEFDESKPTGMQQKLMDSSRARSFGWQPTTSLREGLHQTYIAFLEQGAGGPS